VVQVGLMPPKVGILFFPLFLLQFEYSALMVQTLLDLVVQEVVLEMEV
jgi:hypothetical protein